MPDIQPSGVVYCINDVPAAIPDTIPVDGSIVAFAVLLLDQVPPGTELLRAVVLPTQTAGVPLMGVEGYTVAVVVATHPDPEV